MSLPYQTARGKTYTERCDSSRSSVDRVESTLSCSDRVESARSARADWIDYSSVMDDRSTQSQISEKSESDTEENLGDSDGDLDDEDTLQDTQSNSESEDVRSLILADSSSSEDDEDLTDDDDDPKDDDVEDDDVEDDEYDSLTANGDNTKMILDNYRKSGKKIQFNKKEKKVLLTGKYLDEVNLISKKKCITAPDPSPTIPELYKKDFGRREKLTRLINDDDYLRSLSKSLHKKNNDISFHIKGLRDPFSPRQGCKRRSLLIIRRIQLLNRTIKTDIICMHDIVVFAQKGPEDMQKFPVPRKFFMVKKNTLAMITEPQLPKNQKHEINLSQTIQPTQITEDCPTIPLTPLFLEPINLTSVSEESPHRARLVVPNIVSPCRIHCTLRSSKELDVRNRLEVVARSGGFSTFIRCATVMQIYFYRRILGRPKKIQPCRNCRLCHKLFCTCHMQTQRTRRLVRLRWILLKLLSRMLARVLIHRRRMMKTFLGRFIEPNLSSFVYVLAVETDMSGLLGDRYVLMPIKINKPYPDLLPPNYNVARCTQNSLNGMNQTSLSTMVALIRWPTLYRRFAMPSVCELCRAYKRAWLLVSGCAGGNQSLAHGCFHSSTVMACCCEIRVCCGRPTHPEIAIRNGGGPDTDGPSEKNALVRVVDVEDVPSAMGAGSRRRQTVPNNENDVYIPSYLTIKQAGSGNSRRLSCTKDDYEIIVLTTPDLPTRGNFKPRGFALPKLNFLKRKKSEKSKVVDGVVPLPKI